MSLADARLMHDKTAAVWAAAIMTLVTGSAMADPIFGTNDPPADARRDSKKDPAERREDAERWRPGFGARVGGYGFRDPSGGEKWDACRMNGFGVFGTLDANKYLYGELAVDFYSAAPDTVEAGLDRTSTHALTGVGFRMVPDFVLTPYIMLGGGAEYTRVELPQGDLDAVYPMGFAGLGLELNVTREIKLGATFRMLATSRPVIADNGEGNSIYGSSEAALTGENQKQPEMEFDLASQGQFFLRYAM
jgi:hypothetical protein